MDDNAAQPPTRRRRVLIAAAAVAVALAGGITAWVLLDSPSPRHAYAAPPVIVPSTPTPSTAAPTPTATPRPVVPHDFVAAAVPTAFTLSGQGFTIRAHVCAMPPVFPLDPPGEQHHTVCWVTKGFGYKPGSSSQTSYVLGHSWAEDSLEVLNKASERATRNVLHTKPQQMDGVPVYPAKSLVGSRITLRTRTGTLVYLVRDAFGVDKYKLGEIDRIMNPHVRNRLVVITCAELNGVDYNYNIVLDGRLISSRKAA